MADTHARDLFAWLNEVSRDSAILPSGFKLAFVIGQHINRRSGEAWPTQETLANLIGASPRTVRSLTDDLVARGFLVVTAGRGPRNPNRYRLVMGQNRKPTSVLPAHETGKPLPLFDLQTGNPAQKNRKPTSDLKRKPTSDRTIEGTIEEPLNRVSNGISIGNAFETWWRIYPKKKKKDAAQKAYDRIIKNGEASATELLAGAERYASERRQQNPRYTQHPTSWLNAGCWKDEPEHPRQQGVFAGIASYGGGEQ